MNIDKDFIESIIRDVIKEEMNKSNKKQKKHIDPSGIISLDPNTFELEKFPFKISSDRVLIQDVLTLEESPRLGCGIMEMDDTSFEWNLTYDEVDYIIDGTLEIIIDGRKVTANAGEVIFIPKNTKITFSAPNKARFLYVCYPANWSEQ